MNPCMNARGLCLASTATQKGDLSALASPTDTSESCDSGHHDKLPVCNQNLPEAERPLYAVLPWPIYQEPDHNSGGRTATVSLCCGEPLQGDGHPCTECLLAYVPLLSQGSKSGKMPLYTFIPPRSLRDGDS